MNDLDGPAVARLKENVLAAQVDAAFQKHELGEFLPVEGELHSHGYEAECSMCGRTVYVSNKVIYSILAVRCPGTRASR